jgi:hypothetical protein
MKIAQYHGPHGKRDNVRFIKGEDSSAFDTAWDRIYVTTLFSFEYPRIAQTIDFALRGRQWPCRQGLCRRHRRIADARPLPARAQMGRRRFIKGLLTAPPAVALELDDFSEELYADDITGTPIEDLVPDYSILEQVDYEYPVRDAYFAYCSRGCIRKCHFCGVPKLEGGQRDTESLTAVVRSIDELYGPKRDLILMDNNVVASPRFREIIAEIRDLGFVPGAKLTRPGRPPVQHRVDFNQGVDARILCKDPMYLRELASICLKPLRIAFDHLGVKKPYEQAVRYAAEHGLTELSNYMLYNFHDGPQDLFERMRLNVTLNEELGIRIWSFPMRFQPTDRPDRGHIGEKWNRYQLRSMQIILQATHGIVSGEPTFFKRAFGDTYDDYQRILMLPHDFIFNRDWYENHDGSGVLDEFRSRFAKLDASDLAELKQLLSSRDPRDFGQLPALATTAAVRDILGFYVPVPKAELFGIWERKRAATQTKPSDFGVPDDERVEDAGLDAEDSPSTPLEETTAPRKAA